MLTQVDSSSEGNTKTSSQTKQPRIRSRKWCFTLNNYTQSEYKMLTQNFKDFKYIFGKEVGDDKKTPHIQGYVESKNQRSFNSIKTMLPRAHIEKAKGSAKQNWLYCSKDGDFESNMDFRSFADKMKQKVLDLRYQDVVWKPWQQQVLDLKNDDRTINWFWDETGDIGKSYISQYLVIKRNAVICSGKKADIFNQVNMMFQAEIQPELIVCDIPRKSMDYFNYDALEQLKNGMIYSGKYEGGVCIFPPPLVIVFANEEPDRSTMSQDRWNVIKIEGCQNDTPSDNNVL